MLTMSTPWQLHLLPSEWSFVKERNETLKSLVPNDHPATIANLQPRPARIARLQSTQPPCIFFCQPFQVPQKTANQSAERPSQIQSILHNLPDGRRRGELAMVNREPHPSGQIPERALPPDETNTAACPDSVC